MLGIDCDAQLQYSRRDNLLFSGIQATTTEVTATAIGQDTAASLDSVTEKIIAFGHCNLPVNDTQRNTNLAYQLRSNYPTDKQIIIVCFFSKSTHNKVYNARTTLHMNNNGKQP